MGDKGVNGRITLKLILNKQGLKMWTGIIWHIVVSSGGFLWTQ
jgi:hypothetical protein